MSLPDAPRLVAPEDVRATVAGLVDAFTEHIEEYTRSSYNEETARRGFIDKFFKALKWDVANDEGLAENYRDVRHGSTILVGGRAKAPDYCFCYGGQRKFFVEAKKPFVNVADDREGAYQLRRYGWSAKLPLSILTNFRQFAVYDCRFRPKVGDGPGVARLALLGFEEYDDTLDAIYSIFSKEAIPRGWFDRYVADARKHHGTTEVDDEFLREIEGWREGLAKDIARGNPSLDVRELNACVHVLVDRILFLRIAEDRGVEPYGDLGAATEGTSRVDHRLLDLFVRAEQQYDSGLFDFGPQGDTLARGLSVSDEVLKPILRGLYFPECPYEFSVISADILGSVYERFLGKVIRLTAGHRAKVEEKPEVRKAGGVYYTPEYIVDYIVEHTVGEMLREAAAGAEPAAPPVLRILDPACGSGSFLLGAYQYLLDWHWKAYLGDPTRWSKGKDARIIRTGPSDWRLTLAERKRILTDSIYGVDIDRQAVEVTKLNLLLKCLEGGASRAPQQRRLLHDRMLPNIDPNIRCGNSLVGPDYWEGCEAGLFDDEEVRRVNPFDWDQAFPAIMKGGGFDAVIGNPPYLGGRKWTEELRSLRPYLLARYRGVRNQFDLYVPFLERSLHLARAHGRVGFITPATWLNNRLTTPIRRVVLDGADVRRIVDYRFVRVFPDPTVLPVVVILEPTPEGAGGGTCIVERADTAEDRVGWTARPADWRADPDAIINIVATPTEAALVSRLTGAYPPLSSRGKVGFGVKLYQKGKGSPPQLGGEETEGAFEARERVDSSYLPYLEGRNLGRYAVGRVTCWVRYGPHLAEPREIRLFKGPRALVRRIAGDRLVVAYHDKTLVVDQMVHTVQVERGRMSAAYVTGVLGSRLASWYLVRRYNRNEKTFPEVRVGELSSLPIRVIDFESPSDVRQHDRMVTLVGTMLELSKRLQRARMKADRDLIQRRIDATDQQIDRLVYELYGLTQEEIAIVEGVSR